MREEDGEEQEDGARARASVEGVADDGGERQREEGEAPAVGDHACEGAGEVDAPHDVGGVEEQRKVREDEQRGRRARQAEQARGGVGADWREE